MTVNTIINVLQIEFGNTKIANKNVGFFQNQYFISLPIKLFCFLKDVTKWFNSQSLTEIFTKRLVDQQSNYKFRAEFCDLFSIYLKKYLNKSWCVIGSINKENKVNPKSHKNLLINIIWNITQRMRNVWDSFLAKKQRIFWPWKCFFFVYFAL